MNYFLAMSYSNEKSKTACFFDKVNEHYPLGETFPISISVQVIRDSIISDPSMVQRRLFQEVSDNNLKKYGRFVICRFPDGYFDYHGSDLWNWLNEETTHDQVHHGQLTP